MLQNNKEVNKLTLKVMENKVTLKSITSTLEFREIDRNRQSQELPPSPESSRRGLTRSTEPEHSWADRSDTVHDLAPLTDPDFEEGLATKLKALG